MWETHLIHVTAWKFDYFIMLVEDSTCLLVSATMTLLKSLHIICRQVCAFMGENCRKKNKKTAVPAHLSKRIYYDNKIKLFVRMEVWTDAATYQELVESSTSIIK